MTRPYREIHEGDVGGDMIHAFGKYHDSPIGLITRHDIGRRFYQVGDTIQAENDEQVAARRSMDATQEARRVSIERGKAKQTGYSAACIEETAAALRKAMAVPVRKRFVIEALAQVMTVWTVEAVDEDEAESLWLNGQAQEQRDRDYHLKGQEICEIYEDKR